MGNGNQLLHSHLFLISKSDWNLYFRYFILFYPNFELRYFGEDVNASLSIRLSSLTSDK